MSGGEERPPLRYETIIIVGGGCYGGYYVRQLHRAAQAGALTADALLVVDRDADCAVARSLRESNSSPIPTTVRVADWHDFFQDYLTMAAVDRPDDRSGDAIVPSPLMPHLMAEWLVDRARRRWPNRSIETAAIGSDVPVPWRPGADGTHYVSFAEWMCPVNCIEPRTCPETRGPRHWSLPTTVSEFAVSVGARSAVMHCRHRAYGVGMFDTREVLSADDVVHDAGNGGRADVIIGTVSHCHGALTRLVIGPLIAKGNSRDH